MLSSRWIGCGIQTEIASQSGVAALRTSLKRVVGFVLKRELASS
jgi:hypothetical protein